MKKVLLFLLLVLSLSANAEGARYCLSYQDYLDNKWVNVDSIEVVIHSRGHQFWVGGNDYKFVTGDKATDKILKSKAFLVEWRDSLYINCKKLSVKGGGKFGSGYNKAQKFKDDGILFTSERIGAAMTGGQTVGMMFGLIGGIAATNDIMKYPICYLITKDNALSAGDKKMHVFPLIDKYMEVLLAEQPEALATYKSVKRRKERELPANVLDVFHSIGWVGQR